MFKKTDKGRDLLEAIDEHIESQQEDGFRAHLGASLIGRICEREIWYGWRWVTQRKHDARMLRLFNRGHLEEFRFEEWISPVCEKFWATDPRTGEQIRVSDFHGYFGGSLDGVVRNPFGHDGDFLTEFKTHNEKSFLKLLMEGVEKSKPEHYVQMQIYLHYNPKLKGAYYFAINKNNDALHIEYVERDPDCARVVLEKVARILKSDMPPERFDAAKPEYYYCKHFCDHSNVCWYKGVPHKSCRSCAFIEPTDEGFTCTKYEKLLTVEEQKKGCDSYERHF